VSHAFNRRALPYCRAHGTPARNDLSRATAYAAGNKLGRYRLTVSGAPIDGDTPFEHWWFDVQWLLWE